MNSRMLPVLLLAATLCAPAAVAADGVALRHVRVIDGRGGTPLEDATVLVRGSTIEAVGTASMPVPDDVEVLDLPGRTVLPGLVSDHSHVGITDDTDVGSANYTRSNIERQLRQFQRFGVTTVTSLGMNGALFGELRDEAHAGIGPGADLFGADRGIGVPDAAPPVNIAKGQLFRPVTVDDARSAVRQMAARRPDFIKIWVDDFNHTLPTRMSPEIYQAVIEEAHAHGLRVAAHIYYLEDARRLVDAGVDVIAHGIRDRPVDASFIAAMKQHGTWYVPTLGLDESFYIYAQDAALHSDPFLRAAVQPALLAQLGDAAWRQRVLSDTRAVALWQDGLRINQRNLRALVDAGVNVGFGTDSGATPLRIPGYAEHRELALAVEAGLTPLQAITLATHDAAALLGLRDRGVIAKGMRADLLIVQGDPGTQIADTRRIEAVWQAGRQVSGNLLPRTTDTVWADQGHAR